MDSRYRVAEYVQHADASGGWCGPLVPSDEHPRAGEMPEDVVCIACGDLCRGVDKSTVKAVRRLAAAEAKSMAEHDRREAELDRLRRAGVDVVALAAREPGRRVRRRMVQVCLFREDGGSG